MLPLPSLPWSRQPQIEVQATHPNCSFAANYLHPFARNSPRTPNPTSSGQIMKTSYGGKGIAGSATDSAAVVYPNTQVIPANASDFTIIAAGSWGAESRRQSVVFYGDESGGSAAQHTLVLNATSGGADSSGIFSAWTYKADVGGFKIQLQSSASTIDGRYHVIAWRNGANADLWRDGVSVLSTSSGAAYGLPSAYPVYVNATNVSSTFRTVITATHCVLIFQRALSDIELRMYTRNPWQLFRPLSRSIYMPAAGAATITGPLIGGSHLLTNGPLINGRLAA